MSSRARLRGHALGQRVRLRYSGLVAFAGQLLTMVVGMAFTVMATRRLSVADYGLWQAVGTLGSYLLMPTGFYGYWATRDAARGRGESAKTSAFAGLVFGLAIALVYIAVTLPIAHGLGVSWLYFGLYSIALLFLSEGGSLGAVALGTRPQHCTLSDLSATAVKVLVGYVLIVLLDLGLIGVVISFITFSAFKVVHYSLALRDLMEDSRVSLKLLKSWLRKFWLPLLGTCSATLLQLDVLVVISLMGATEPIAHFRVINIYLQIACSAGLATIGLYPTLLAEGGRTDRRPVPEAANLLMFILAPTTLLLASSAEHFLALLKSEYAASATIMRAGTAYAFLAALCGLLNGIVAGVETVDLDERAGFRQYLRSSLFKLTAGALVLPTIVVPSLAAIIRFTRPSELDVVLAWYVLYIVAYLTYSLYLLHLSKGALKNMGGAKLDARTVLAIALSAATSSFLAQSLSARLRVSCLFLEALSNVVKISAAYAASYLSLLFLTSPWFRKLLFDSIAFIRESLALRS